MERGGTDGVVRPDFVHARMGERQRSRIGDAPVALKRGTRRHTIQTRRGARCVTVEHRRLGKAVEQQQAVIALPIRRSPPAALLGPLAMEVQTVLARRPARWPKEWV